MLLRLYIQYECLGTKRQTPGNSLMERRKRSVIEWIWWGRIGDSSERPSLEYERP
jgi:hypothetical protein